VLALAAALIVLSPFKVSLDAPTHTPKVNARWFYTVTASDASGEPLKGRLTVQVLDPFGGIHPVEFGNTQRKIVNFSFTGRFRDYVKWPPESRGFRLRLRVTVASEGKAVRRTYWIRPR
jgi:hypothetical protein